MNTPWNFSSGSTTTQMRKRPALDIPVNFAETIVARFPTPDSFEPIDPLMEAQTRALEMIVGGDPVEKVLTYLARVVEAVAPDECIAAVLLVDEEGTLQTAAAPSLPDYYNEAVNGLRPSKDLGTCGVCAATGKVVVTPDIAADGKWSSISHLPLGLNLKAAWSQPILAQDGTVLGTFGTYFRDCREPTALERQLVGVLARTAALAIERKSTEERLRQKASEFETLADNIHQFAWMADSSGWIYWYNKRWFEYTGTTLSEMEGWGWQSVHHPDHVDRVTEKISKCFETGESWEDTFPLRGKDGTYRWFLSRAVPVLDDDGRVMRWFGTNTDITQRREDEQQRSVLIDELNHRVKNTLATVQAIAAQTFRPDVDGEDAKRRFDARLVTLAEAHTILTKQNRESADINEVISGALRPHAGADRIDIEGVPLRIQPRAVLAIAMGIHELATNALKYGALSAPEGRVRVCWRVENQESGKLLLEWSESGGPPVVPPERSGFGTRLIERSLAGDLDGEAVIKFLREGVCCTITGSLDTICAK